MNDVRRQAMTIPTMNVVSSRMSLTAQTGQSNLLSYPGIGSSLKALRQDTVRFGEDENNFNRNSNKSVDNFQLKQRLGQAWQGFKTYWNLSPNKMFERGGNLLSDIIIGTVIGALSGGITIPAMIPTSIAIGLTLRMVFAFLSDPNKNRLREE